MSDQLKVKLTHVEATGPAGVRAWLEANHPKAFKEEEAVSDYSKMTTEDFDRLLGDCMEKHGARQLLTVSGVYEAVSEHFNDDVLELWDIEQELNQ